MSYLGNQNEISTLNSRAAATLAKGATFQGVGEDVSKFGRVGVSISTSNQTSGTLFMQVSRDGVNWGGPPRKFGDTRFAQPHMWNIVEKYFRVLYINNGIEAQDLVIQTQYSNNSDILLGHELREELLDETEAIITRSVLVGRADDNHWHNVNVDESGHLQVQDGETVNLLEALLTEQKLTNAYLKIISGGEIAEIKGNR